MTAINIDLLITLTPILAAFGLGGVVYGKSNNKIFSILCLSIVLWAIANYFSLHPVVLGQLIWIRFVMFFAVFLQFMFFLFVCLFPENKIPVGRWKFLILLFVISATMAATISPFLYTAMEERRGETVPHAGPLMPLFAFTIFLFWGLTGYLILKKYRQAEAPERIRWQYILFGFALMFILLIGSQFLAVAIFQETKFIKFGPVFTLPFVISSAYAIIRHQLFNIKLIAAELFTAAIVFALLVKVFLSIDFGDFIFNLVIFVIMSLMGTLLLRATLREIADREKIEKLDKVKSEFLSIASHQLRTPLSAIKGYISMIIEGTYGNPPVPFVKPLENVYASNEKLIGLVNDLLDLSRLEAGKIEFEPSPGSLEKITNEIIGELKINADKKGLYLKFIKPKALLPEIMIDQPKLRQVILNIIDNAIKYTMEGGVTVELRQTNSAEQIIVSDTGAGLDPEEIKSLFQIFTRAAAGTRLHTEGSGVGLHVAKKFIEMHRGRIWVESAGRGQGSAFYIELPMNHEENIN